MKIRVTSHEGTPVFPFESAGPWKNFRREFERNGHSLCSKGYEENCEAIVVNSLNRSILRYLDSSNIPLDKRVFILWEPYIVDKKGYLEEYLKNFGHVYAPSKSWAEKINGEYFPWPQDDFPQWSESIDEWKNRNKRAIMIQSNKFSAVKGERYSLRRKILFSANDEELDLYGMGWNRGFAPDWFHWSSSLLSNDVKTISIRSLNHLGRKYSKYKGSIQNKHETLKKYKVSIVVENSNDYVSEKIFDSIRAGCVTIYVGANLEEYNLSSNYILQLNPNSKDVISKLRHLIHLDDEELYVCAKKSYEDLKQQIRLWDNNIVLENLAKSILKKIET